ncbi:hypothetical protein DFJ58DRAFT_842112 [Suillus subalutaceus]|uniref:uncharacterized protein n=1 Tax=Suillus subalutaceus TaxID=48586 RepID=UPI001B8671C1|nr:uncharacterized protein DFJ58DRAFT_842112 [Suillus subalutaceus]KAG1851629.1 hypothetical protein DFJ58DRAFT_842112 [Suillus subalutaceus]
MTGIQKSSTQWYQLPPIRPLRESLAADSENTLNAATSSTPQSITSTLQSSASTVAVAHTGRWQGEGCLGTTIVPVIDKVCMKIVVKDVKESIITETLNTCRLHDSSSHLSVVTTALSDACSSIIVQDHLIKLWVGKNISALYKNIITLMSTILNRFKECTQDLVENLYELQLTIWTYPLVQVNHNKSTVDFLTGNNSINYIFGGLLEDGREVHYPSEHKAVIQITSRACFCDGYNKFIHLDMSLNNIMAMSATAACCSLLEFATGIFKQINFTYASFHTMYMKLMKFIHENIRSCPTMLARWNTLFQLLHTGAR